MKNKVLTAIVIILLIGMILLGLFTYYIYSEGKMNKPGEVDKTGEIDDSEDEEERVLSDDDILALGKSYYLAGVEVIGNLNFAGEGVVKEPHEYKDIYRKAKLTEEEMRNTILKDFSKEYQNKVLSGESAEGNPTNIRIIDNEVYQREPGRGRDLTYIEQDELELINATNDKIEFNVKVKYLQPSDADKYTGELYPRDYPDYDFPEEDLKTITNKFTLIKEDGRYKILEIHLPY